MSKLIAIGSGGFLMEAENQLLDRYCLKCTGKTVPKVCFVPTASGDSEEFLSRFERAFSRYSCEPSHLTFFRKGERKKVGEISSRPIFQGRSPPIINPAKNLEIV